MKLKPARGFTERITFQEAKVREVAAVLDNQRCAYVLWWHDRNGVVFCDKPGWISLHNDGHAPYLCHHHDLAGAELRAERKRDAKRFAGCKTRAEALAVRDGVAV